jgi:hypothetical protein
MNNEVWAFVMRPYNFDLEEERVFANDKTWRKQDIDEGMMYALCMKLYGRKKKIKIKFHFPPSSLDILLKEWRKYLTGLANRQEEVCIKIVSSFWKSWLNNFPF